MPPAVTLRKIQVRGRRTSAFLNQSVQQHHAASLIDTKKNPGNPVSVERTSDFEEPATIGRQSGIPSGQPNSTVLISSPIRFLSASSGKPFSHSRTGSPPLSVL